MGHNVCYVSADENCDRKKILAQICEKANRDGDGYTGPLKWHDEIEPRTNRDAAEKWIRDHDNGWYDDHCVRYYDYSRATITKKIRELQDKHAALTLKMGEYMHQHSVSALKASYIGCPKCGSKLAKEYLSGEYCPLCRTDLRSKTTQETLAKYQEKSKAIIKAIQAEEEKQRRNRKVRWLIKYEYHS